MEELVKLVSQRAGIPEDKAQQAVTTVIGYLKDRLPGPIAGQVDSILGGGSGGTTGEGGAFKGLGGLFGHKQ